MCGLYALAALTVWKMSTPLSTLILSNSVIQVMNTPLRDMPSLKRLNKTDIEECWMCTHTRIHPPAHPHTHTQHIHGHSQAAHMHAHICTCFTDSLAHDHQRCLCLLLLLHCSSKAYRINDIWRYTENYFVIIIDNFEALSTIERQVQIIKACTLLLFSTCTVVISQSGLGMVARWLTVNCSYFTEWSDSSGQNLQQDSWDVCDSIIS